LPAKTEKGNQTDACQSSTCRLTFSQSGLSMPRPSRERTIVSSK
jgi:hypothetical protein